VSEESEVNQAQNISERVITRSRLIITLNKGTQKMTKADLNKYAKRIQSRLSRRGFSFSLEECRQALSEQVGESLPSDTDLIIVVGRLSKKAAQEEEAGELATAEAAAAEVTEAKNTAGGEEVAVKEPKDTTDSESLTIPFPQVSEDLSKNKEVALSIQAPAGEKPELDQDPWTPASLTKRDVGKISAPGRLTEHAIAQAVEEEFGKESVQTKAAIIDYVARDTYTTAQELKDALQQLRQLKLDILMKVVLDHNQAAQSDENLIKEALTSASSQRKEESADFFSSLDNLTRQMRLEFGLSDPQSAPQTSTSLLGGWDN
jgi:hypothetical protein